MTDYYTSQSISGYNTSPPSDDGQETSANQITWDKHKTKLADPIKTLVEAINTEVDTAFGKLFGNGKTSISSTTTIDATHLGKHLEVTGTTTLNLTAAATLGAGFICIVKHADSNVLTIDPNGAETIDGRTTLTMNKDDDDLILICDGSNWHTIGLKAEAIQDGAYVYAADTGSADAYTIALTPAPTAYVAGQMFYFIAGNANTGACTLDVNSLGVKSIKLPNGNDPAGGDIGTSAVSIVVYDGTNFVLASATPLVVKTVGAQTIAGAKTFSDNLEISTAANPTFTMQSQEKVVGTYALIDLRALDDGDNETSYARITADIEDPTNTSEDGSLSLSTVQAGSLTDVMKLEQGVIIGSPTGGDKGAGTLNATAVYDDNTLLTCYVFDAAIDGAINDAKWHGKVPDFVDTEGNITPRTHEPMLKFKSRLGGPEDPLDIDKYAAHWKTKRHLTSLPNEAAFDPERGMPTGEWIQRLIETVEIQAVLIENLNQRIKALEP